MKKIVQNSKISVFLASACSSARNGGGGGGGVHPGLLGERQQWGWGVAAHGGGDGARVGGGQEWRGLQPLRNALHTISLSLQNSLI